MGNFGFNHFGFTAFSVNGDDYTVSQKDGIETSNIFEQFLENTCSSLFPKIDDNAL